MKVLKLSIALLALCSSTLFCDEKLDDYISKNKKEQFDYDFKKNEAESSRLRDSWIAPLNLNYSHTKSNPYGDEQTSENAAIKMDQPIFQSGGIYYGIKFAEASKIYSNYSIDVVKRKLIKDAISLCKKAGIRIIMLTGDYELTAKAIAKEVGIIGDSLNGDEIDRLSRKELIKKLKTTNIIARVSPKHKREILELLQEQGEIVAMTGDGVNDATSLKKADIGAAVGSGTDVAKQSSDIIILDNNFSSIVEAVKEGRTIYTNIKKFICV